MPEMLLEIGCEELPASFVRKAHEQLRDELVERLQALGLHPGPATSMGTPRRLIVSIDALADRQSDRTVEARGPSAKAAYEADGSPSRALLGFCKGQGVDPADVRVEGDYVFVNKLIPGRPTADVLSEVIPEAIRALTFDKTMRWGSHRMRFARPIRWILAAFGGGLVTFEIEGVASGLESRGHRFNHPGSFVATSLHELTEELRRREVEPDEAIREIRVLNNAKEVAPHVQLDKALVVENANLTEWPSAVLGSFDARYLELPEEVLVTVMAKHERFFPVRDAESDSLTNQFVSIRNGGVDEVVAAGNAWVLGCRFNDAKFFYDEDKKHSLDEFLEKTSGIVFQAELGTVRERADRLALLTAKVAEHIGANAEEVEFARLAGLYAKADLSTGLVGELDELQGVIGGLYAKREGMPEPVCEAIANHYRVNPMHEYDSVLGRTTGCLILADNIDKLAGYLGKGLVPSGSSDPYALRRAAGVVLHESLLWSDITGAPIVRDLGALLNQAASQYKVSLEDPLPLAIELFAQRCEKEFGGWPDVGTAIYAADPTAVLRPRELTSRWQTLNDLLQDVGFVQAATRPLNIVAAADKKGLPKVPLDESKLDSPEGLALLHAAQHITPVRTLGDMPEPPSPWQLKTLQPAIDAFFESTMVMVADTAVRDARLAMLREVCDVLLRVGDFSKLVIPG